MTRKHVVLILLICGISLIGLDLRSSAEPNPFNAPAPLALGSGQASSGAHCAAPLGK